MRARRAHGDDGDYDSVLDTMTNVVGILIIVVAVTQLNVSSAVGRARNALVETGEVIDHPPVSAEALDGARRKRDAAKKRLAELPESAAQGNGSTSAAEWEELRKRLQGSLPVEMVPRLQREIRQLKAELKVIANGLKELGEQRVRLDELSERLESELANLKKRKPRAPTPIVMRLPDPDESRTTDLDRIDYLIKGGRVYSWHVKPLTDRWFRDLTQAMAERFEKFTWSAEQLLWMAEFLNKKGYSNENWRLKFRAVRDVLNRLDLQIQYVLKPSARRTALNALSRSTSPYGRDLRRYRPREHWLFFYVMDDSFATYAAARRLAEERGFAVGWQPLGRGGVLVGSLRGGGSKPKAD